MMAPSWWNPQVQPFPQQAPQGQPMVQQEEQQPQVQTPEWDRTKFRDAWMSSGIQNVPDMQNWLRTSGWGGHVGVGGSKGDVMQLPSGENIDAVLAAGLGGNRGGPQWTGRGEHGGQFTPFAQQKQQGGIGPSWGNQPMMGGWQQGNPYQATDQGWKQNQQYWKQMQPGFMQNMQNKMWQQGQQMRMQHRPGGISPSMNRMPMQGGMTGAPWTKQAMQQKQQAAQPTQQKVQYY